MKATKKTNMLSSLCFVMCAQLSTAAVVSFSSQVLAADGSNAATAADGTLVASQAYGNDAGGGFTINGVNWKLDTGPSLAGTGAIGNRNAAATFYDGNLGVQAVINSLAFGAPLTLGFSGLTPGQQYQFQFISLDIAVAGLANTDAADRLQTVNVTSAGDSGTLDYQQTFDGARSAANARAALVTGTWIQDEGSSTMNFQFATRGTNDNAIVNGWILQAVPEPSSAALLGLAGATLLLRRRRK